MNITTDKRIYFYLLAIYLVENVEIINLMTQDAHSRLQRKKFKWKHCKSWKISRNFDKWTERQWIRLEDISVFSFHCHTLCESSSSIFFIKNLRASIKVSRSSALDDIEQYRKFLNYCWRCLSFSGFFGSDKTYIRASQCVFDTNPFLTAKTSTNSFEKLIPNSILHNAFCC